MTTRKLRRTVGALAIAIMGTLGIFSVTASPASAGAYQGKGTVWCSHGFVRWQSGATMQYRGKATNGVFNENHLHRVWYDKDGRGGAVGRTYYIDCGEVH